MKTEVLKNGKWIKAQEIPYYPSLMEKVLHFFSKHIYPYTWEKTKDSEGYSNEVFEVKHCLYPNCKVYKIRKFIKGNK